MNNLELSGFIGNVEMSYTANGKPKTQFYVKFTNGKDENGNFEYDFMNCIAWNDLAEEVNGLETDRMYDVRGKYQTRKYINKDGVNCKVHNLIAFEIKPMQVNQGAAPTSTHAPANGQARARVPYVNRGATSRAVNPNYNATKKNTDLDNHPF